MEKDTDSDSHEKDDIKEKESSKSKKSSFSSDKSENKSTHDSTTDNRKEQKPSSLAEFFSKEIEEERAESSESHIDSNELTDENANLTEEEVHEATLAIVDGRTQEVTEELSSSEPDSVEEFEALAGAVFLESLQDLVENNDDVTRETIEQAFQESLEDLSINDTGETDDTSHEEPESDDAQENTEDEVGSSSSQPATPTLTPPISPIVPAPPRQPITPPPTPPVVPPLPPAGGNMNYNLSPNQTNYNTVSAANQNTQPIIVNEVHYHRNNLLLGAVIGYMIGRRGGRKRTEKKLHPKIDNLQKQVTILHDTILDKETKIRSLARVNIANSNEKIIEPAILIERRNKRKEVKETLRRREELSKKPGVEKIGKFSLPALKVFHERRLPDGTENSPKRKQVEVMTEVELLDMVAGLSIHGLSVADVYRKKRLTLESLRQITKEYLRGGPYKQTFSLELLPDEKEIIEIRQDVHKAHNGASQPLQPQPNEQPKQSVVASNSKSSTAEMQTHTSVRGDNTKWSVLSGVITGIVLVAVAAVIYLIN